MFEPYHALVYFAPEARVEYAAAGLKGFWMGYFASRGAALGPVAAEVIAATFYGFAPRMVKRAIPDAWRFSSSQRVLTARVAAVDAALRRLLGDDITSRAVARAAELARRAIDECDVAGRPLFAAQRSLPWPEEPHLVLWHASTLLREHRGDGHVASLLRTGLDGCESLVAFAASGTAGRDLLQPNRGWTDDEWDGACQRLVRRGWLAPDGMLTAMGVAAREEIEHQTDRLAMPPLDRLGACAPQELYDLLLPRARRIVERGGIPMPNPMGVPAP